MRIANTFMGCVWRDVTSASRWNWQIDVSLTFLSPIANEREA